MSQWITDRRPTIDDVDDFYGHCVVYNCEGRLAYYEAIADGEPWQPIPKCEPYVKPKRYVVCNSITGLSVFDNVARVFVGSNIPTSEAAERIAAIYEEVMP